MSNWSAVKSKRVFRALLNIGWQMKRQKGSHLVLEKFGWSDYVWAFHEREEIEPKMLARIAKHTRLPPSDL